MQPYTSCTHTPCSASLLWVLSFHPFREKQIGSGNHLGSLLSDKVVVSSLQEACMLDSYAEDVASMFSALMAGERA